MHYEKHLEEYYLINCGNTDMIIKWSPQYQKILIEGSPAYFIQSHNYCFNVKQLRDAIEYISDVLNVGIVDFDVTRFEYGLNLEIPFDIKDVLFSHTNIPGMKTMSFNNGKYFEDRVLTMKLYDFQMNAKRKLSKETRLQMEHDFGYSPDANYLKLECHYKRPQVAFKESNLTVNTLLNETFEQHCKSDLYNKYQNIKKLGSVEIKNKKQLSSSTLPLIALKKYAELIGIPVDQIIKQVIREYSGILSVDDKKARMKQYRNNMKKIEIKQSPFDVSNMLQNELFN